MTSAAVTNGYCVAKQACL